MKTFRKNRAGLTLLGEVMDPPDRKVDDPAKRRNMKKIVEISAAISAAVLTQAACEPAAKTTQPLQSGHPKTPETIAPNYRNVDFSEYPSLTIEQRKTIGEAVTLYSKNYKFPYSKVAIHPMDLVSDSQGMDFEYGEPGAIYLTSAIANGNRLHSTILHAMTHASNPSDIRPLPQAIEGPGGALPFVRGLNFLISSDPKERIGIGDIEECVAEYLRRQIDDTPQIEPAYNRGYAFMRAVVPLVRLDAPTLHQLVRTSNMVGFVTKMVGRSPPTTRDIKNVAIIFNSVVSPGGDIDRVYSKLGEPNQEQCSTPPGSTASFIAAVSKTSMVNTRPTSLSSVEVFPES